MLEALWKSITVIQDGGNTQNGAASIIKHYITSHVTKTRKLYSYLVRFLSYG